LPGLAVSREGRRPGQPGGTGRGKRVLLAGRTRGRRGRPQPLLPEQFLALEHHADGERQQRGRADPDRHIDEQQLAGDDPADKNRNRDSHQAGAKPDHL
jgi:hypothetical protein